jgi:hypothetical protein
LVVDASASAGNSRDVPVRLLAPLLLVADYVDNLSLGPDLLALPLIDLREHEAAPADPYGITETLCEFEEPGLLVGKLAGVEVVALRLDHADNGLVWR